MKDSVFFLLLGIVCVSVLFPVGFAVWALSSYTNYIDKTDKCQLLMEHLPTGEQAGWNFSKSQDNPIVQKYQKECN